MIAIGMFFCIAITASVVFCLVTWMSASLLGIPPFEVKLFTGPKVVHRRFGETYLALGCFPFGSSIGFLPDSDEGPKGHTGDWKEFCTLHRERYFSAHPLFHAGLAIIGHMAAFAIPAIILGPLMAIEEAWAWMYQVFEGAIQPTKGVELARRGLLALNQLPATQSLALGIAKLVGFNLLPLPSLAGGQFLRYLFYAVSGKKLRNAVQHAPLLFIALILMLALVVCWIINVIRAAMALS